MAQSPDDAANTDAVRSKLDHLMLTKMQEHEERKERYVFD
jgi:hypothetical protein